MLSQKTLVMICMSIGSFVGGYVPVFFGASAFSYWSIFASAVGGVIGIWAGYKMGEI